jgi:hypothetical protein
MMTIAGNAGITGLLVTMSATTAVTLVLTTTSSIETRGMTRTTGLEAPQLSPGIAVAVIKRSTARPALIVTGAGSTGDDTVRVRVLLLRRKVMKMIHTPRVETSLLNQAAGESTGARKTSIVSETAIAHEIESVTETGETGETAITTVTTTEITTTNDPGTRTVTESVQDETAKKT